MQFAGVVPDENGIISLFLEGDNDRHYNPFLVGSQAMVGHEVWKDYRDF